MINRRNFCALFGAAAVTGCASTSSSAITVDENLTAFMSDIHVAGGGIPTQWGKQPTYQNSLFTRAVNQVLALNPRPKRVVIFGDIALWFGWHQDYEASAPDIKRLEAAGIEVTLTMGNHDKRDVFLRYYPQYAKTSPVAGRIVSVVNLGHADLFLLDSLNSPDPTEGTANIVSGILDKAQQEWLAQAAKSAQRPFFVGSHHPPQELRIGKEPLLKVLEEVPNFAGYIYGHNHRWTKQWHHTGYSKPHVMRSLCLPSTGWWGDIGFALCRTEPHKAVVALKESDFFFPRPLKEGAQRPQEWDDILEENKGQLCTFRY